MPDGPAAAQGPDGVREISEAVAELVGQGRRWWWWRAVPRGRAGRVAVVELRGGAGDADRFMQQLSAHQTRLPVNNPSGPAAPVPGGRPTVAAWIADVAAWYRDSSPKRRRPLRFRRLRMVQEAYEAWERNPGDDHHHVNLLKTRAEAAAREERGGLLHELIRLISGAQGNVQSLLYALGAVGAAFTLVPVAELLVRHYAVLRPARTWLARKLGCSTSTIYLGLCRVHAEPPEVRDQWLVDAFLADIDAYYHFGRRWNRSRLPLLLLPDAADGTEAGRFLRLLRADQTGYPVARRTGVVVVARTGDGTGVTPTADVVVTDVAAAAETGVPAPAFTLPRVPADGVAGIGQVGGAEVSRAWRRGKGPVTAGVVTVVMGLLVAGGTWTGYRLAQNCGPGLSLWPRLVQQGDQCIGVTDGSYADRFIPELRAVGGQIAEENERAEQEPSTVTVAFMLPMTPDTAPERRQIVSEVEGAYLAQRRANRQDYPPRIRLVLANPGLDYGHWGTVTDELRDMVDDARFPLRAVTGFNLSVKDTEDALHNLTDAGIPVVGGPITADNLDNVATGGVQRFPGMARTSPTNSDQARALVNFNSSTSPDDSVLVADDRPGDTYNASIASAFEKAVSPRTKTNVFTSPSPTELGNVPSQFLGMTSQICSNGARNIYFAGRPLHLRYFLRALANNPCKIAPRRRVITASGASTLSLYLTADDWSLLSENSGALTLEYSAVGHPDTWKKGEFGPARDFYVSSRNVPGGVGPGRLTTEVMEDYDKISAHLGGAVNWQDSRAMTAFDSVWLATQVLHQVQVNVDGTPALEDVATAWRTTFSTKGVAGMTGWFCLDNTGNPYNKAVSVVTLDPKDKSIRFVGVAWPTGSPSMDCEVRNRKM